MPLFYKYTVNSNDFLSSVQRDFYETNGYIVFRKLVSDDLIDECYQHFVDICNGKCDANMMMMKDQTLKHNPTVKGEFLINKVQDFLDDNVFFKYANDANVVRVIESIIGPNITAAHSMLINKPPDSTYDASRHPLHQDLHYFPFRPAEKVVASWTAMEKIDEINGCLFVIPGSHKGKLYPHVNLENMKNFAYYGIQGFDHVPKVNLIMEKGDTVFFHPLLLHGSGPNLSKGFRKAISIHYADTNCDFVNVRGTSQDIAVKEVEDVARKLFGAYIKFEDIWKTKSRLLRGPKGNFQKMDAHL